MASYVSTFTGNGSEVHFTAGFPVLRLTDLAVVVNNVWLTLGVDYSVSGSTSGPLATLTTAPANGAVVVLRSAVGYTPTDPSVPNAIVPTMVQTDEAIYRAFRDADAAILASGAAPANVGIALVTATGSTATRTVANRFADCVNVKDFGAVGDGSTDDTAAVQDAVDFCIANGKSLIVDGLCRLTGSVTIDRPVDSATLDFFFRVMSVSGGGFYVSTAIPMFSSTITYTTVPVTQLVYFDGIRFEASSPSLAAYVLDGARFLRTVFHGCDFVRVKALYATTYTQSLYFTNCQARWWNGYFVNSTYATFDFKMNNCILEFGDGGGIRLLGATGCSVQNSLLENIDNGPALEASYISGLHVSGCFFEDNPSGDISFPGGAPGAGISLTGNYFNSDATISWPSNTVNAVSIGNVGIHDPMHTIVGTAQVFINDSNLTPGAAVTNLSQQGTSTFTGNVSFAGGLAGSLVTEAFTANLNAAATVDSTLTIADGEMYRVTVSTNDGANTLDGIGEWLVARKGSGTRVEAVKAAASGYTCTVASYKIRITNGDSNTHNGKVSIVRLA